MELRQIQYFVAIAELEHFGRASQRLRIAQPALSRQMKLLEAELGTPLFERLPRGVRLTAAGRVFLDRTRGLARQLEHAALDARAAAEGTVGVLRLGVIEVAAWEGIVPDSIRAFRLAFPEVRLALSALPGARQIDAIRLKELDAGLLYNPPDDPALSVLPLVRHPLMLAVPAESPLATRTDIRLADLADQDFIGFQRRESPRFYDDLQAALARRGFQPRISAEMRTEADMLALVSAGAGVALVNSCQQFRPPQGVRFRPVAEVDVSLSLALVHLADEDAPVVRRYAEVLRGMLVAGG